MDRRDFIRRLVQGTIVILLVLLTALLGKKIDMKKVCSNCPDYPSCPGLSSCEILISR